MADDPKKKKADGKRISQQPHEQAYQKKKSKSKAGDSNANSKNEKRNGSQR